MVPSPRQVRHLKQLLQFGLYPAFHHSFLNSSGFTATFCFVGAYRPLVSRMDIPVSIKTEIPTLRKPLLFRLVFRQALDSRIPKLADYRRCIFLRMPLDLMRLSFLRFRFFIKWHVNHLLSCQFFVSSAIVHSQHWVEYSKLFLDTVHGAAEETGVSREAKLCNDCE